MRNAHSGDQQKNTFWCLFGADAGVGALRKVASGKFLANNERRRAKAPVKENKRYLEVYMLKVHFYFIERRTRGLSLFAKQTCATRIPATNKKTPKRFNIYFLL